MTHRIHLPMRLAAVVLALLLFSGCRPVAQEPARPSTVPATAVWTGGADGGVFVDLRQGAGRVSGTVYSDNSGEVLYKGTFRLDPPGTLPPDFGKAEIYNGWDGRSIHLRDGRRLVAGN